MSLFANVEDLAAAMHAEPGMAEKVAQLRGIRYSAAPEQFERLLWLLLTEAACVGGRMAIGELQAEGKR